MRVFWSALIVVGLASAALSQDGSAGGDRLQPLMTIEGEGRIDVAPDMATVRLGVVNEDREARAAIEGMSRGLDAVLSRLGAFRIEGRDVQTSDLSVQPRWDNRVQGQPPRIVGFVARSTLTVRVRDLDDLGAVLDAVARDGANSFEGVVFGLQDPDPVEDAARAAAVADARRKAALYAEAADVGLGPIVRISESGGGMPQPMMMDRMAMASEAAMPMAEGELTIRARVSLVYELAPD